MSKTPPEHRTIAGRYRLVRALGRGGHGEVWEAEDRLTAEAVAVKLIRGEPGDAARRVRREIATLRLFRVPGVVRLRDEGIEDGMTFMVMDLVRGAPFPGAPLPCPWASIAAPALGLLETLARIHALGIVHRDLKPENVLVTAEGRPVVLDFGLASGGSVGAEVDDEGYLLGTPLYLAPEQIRGEPVTPATDLYAVGVLLYEALSGRPPHKARELNELFAARLAGLAPPLAEVAPDVPEAVARVVDRLLAVEQADRPQTARSAHRALRGDLLAEDALLPDIAGRAGADGRLDEDAMRTLFSSPERFFHIPSDAARLLLDRTAGEVLRVAEELGAWLRAGLARPDGGALAMDRDALESLEPLPSERRLIDALTREGASSGALALANEACALAEDLAREGRLRRAAAVLREALLASRSATSAGGEAERRAAEEAMLGCWAEIALLEGTPPAIDKLLYELCRGEGMTPGLARIEALARAGLALATGADRATLAAEAVPALGDPRLDRYRHGLRVHAARRGAQERLNAVLEDVREWAVASGDPGARAALAGWTGRLRYQEGDFEAAAELHARAAAEEPWMTGRLSALLHCASAWMEAFRFDAAAEVAAAARTLAEHCRHPHHEARATWLLRQVAYRRGDAIEPDPALVDDAAGVGVPDLEALIALTEAAIAWRAGRNDLAVGLAAQARRRWVGMKKQWAAGLARCLELACGATPARGELRERADEARRCPVHGLGIQMLGLLAMARPAGRPALARGADALAATVPRGSWPHRMEVLSVSEALLALRDRGGSTSRTRSSRS